jgi:hypothetical protein
MIAFPPSVKVWIAGAVTDMRCGMNSLALKVQQGLGRDPHAGEVIEHEGPWNRKQDVELATLDSVRFHNEKTHVRSARTHLIHNGRKGLPRRTAHGEHRH